MNSFLKLHDRLKGVFPAVVSFDWELTVQEMGPVVLPNFCHSKAGAFGTFRSKSTFSFVSL